MSDIRPVAPDHWNEAELLAGVLAGENSAWNELLRRFRSIAFHCITKVTRRLSHYRSNIDVDEVYAELLVTLLRDDKRKLRLYDPRRGTRLGSWIGLLATNVAHDHMRGGRR